eukprot:763282-Hanusia_phi.AAC.3
MAEERGGLAGERGGTTREGDGKKEEIEDALTALCVRPPTDKKGSSRVMRTANPHSRRETSFLPAVAFGGGGGGTISRSGRGGDGDGEGEEEEVDGEIAALLKQYNLKPSDLPAGALALSAEKLSRFLRSYSSAFNRFLINSWPAWRDKMLADPEFAYKMMVEETVGLGLAMSGTVAARGKDILKELDFFLTDCAGETLAKRRREGGEEAGDRPSCSTSYFLTPSPCLPCKMRRRDLVSMTCLVQSELSSISCSSGCSLPACERCPRLLGGLEDREKVAELTVVCRISAQLAKLPAFVFAEGKYSLAERVMMMTITMQFLSQSH